MRYGGLGVGSGSFFVGFRGRARVGDSIKGSIYNRGEDLFTFFVYLRFAHPVHPIGDIYCPIAPKNLQFCLSLSTGPSSIWSSVHASEDASFRFS